MNDLQVVTGFAERLRALIPDMLIRNGELVPSAFVYAQRRPNNFPDPTAVFPAMIPLMANMLPNGVLLDKDTFFALVRAAAKETEASAVVTVQEAWVYSASIHEPIVRASTHKDCKEIVVVYMEHKALPGLVMWVADIQRDAEGNPSLSEFQTVSDGHDHSVEVFIRMLPVDPKSVN